MKRIALAAALALAAATPAAAAPPQVVRQGAHLYGRYCIACHGANGGGVGSPHQIGAAPGREQTTLTGLGPPLRGVGARAADFYLRTGYMPLPHIGVQPRRGRVIFSEAEIRALVAYVASLGQGPAIPKPQPQRGSLSEGMVLFTQHCAGCHQVAAQGGFLTDAVAPPLESDTAVQIAEAVRTGPYLMPRFSQRAISDAQLDSIIRYVDYVKHPHDPGGLSLEHLGPVPEGMVAWLIAGAALVGCCLLIGRRLHK